MYTDVGGLLRECFAQTRLNYSRNCLLRECFAQI